MAKVGKHDHDKHQDEHADNGAKHQEKHANNAAKHEDKSAGRAEKELFKDLRSADEIYVADFTALNNSGVEAYAILTVDHGSRRTTEDDTLTVRIIADNLDAGVHLQHMHGFENGTDAKTPNNKDDIDLDGYVELFEGAPDYGPILMNLDFPNGSFPITTQDGSFVFKQTYHLPSRTDSGHNTQSHAGDIVTTFDNLDLNHLVIHGLEVPAGAGAGTDGEVGDRTPRTRLDFDENTYKEVLPVAVGEIEQVSLRDARQFISNLANEGFMFA